MKNEPQKGLPPSGIVEIEFKENEFRRLAMGQIESLEVTILIHLDSVTKGKVSVTLTEVIPPEAIIQGYILQASITTDVDQTDETIASHHAQKAFLGELSKMTWHLFGITNDQTKRPICIILVPHFLAAFSFFGKKPKRPVNPSDN